MSQPITTPLLLNLNLGGLKPPEALTLTSNVISSLTGHPFFTNIPLEPLTAAGARLQESARATTAGDHTKIPQRDTDLAAVIKELTRVGFNVQLKAIDDESHLHHTGYQVMKRKSSGTKKSRAPLTALAGLEVINCSEAGEVLISALSQPSAFGYQFQYTDQDPSVESNWVDGGISKGCKKIRKKGLESLKRYTFRGRAHGNDGPGPWSPPVTISVT